MPNIDKRRLGVGVLPQISGKRPIFFLLFDSLFLTMKAFLLTFRYIMFLALIIGNSVARLYYVKCQGQNI